MDDDNEHLKIYLEPQEGKQTQFMSTEADICIYGGAAGGGKSHGLLLEATRYLNINDFGAVIFRASLKQVKNQGGLWDSASAIYPLIGGVPKVSVLTYVWPAPNSKITFAHLDTEDSVLDWQGSQIPLIAFDELTHFSKKQFFYMLSRNRTTCGIKPYVRATTNPDADSWVREMIDWWIGDNGYAIEERSGKVRWFVNQNDQLFWFDTEKEAKKEFPKIPPKSFTFISSNIHDNEILMNSDPNYMANLEALSAVDKERLLHGNWDIRNGAGDYFKEDWFHIVDDHIIQPAIHTARCWDFAATEVSDVNPDPDWTVGLKGEIDAKGIITITDMQRKRFNPTKVSNLLINTTAIDGNQVLCRIPQDPGSAGKAIAHSYITALRGYPVKAVPVTGKKEVRALAASAQAGVGNIRLKRAPWNKDFLTEVSGFPLAAHDDIVDTLSDLVEELTNINGKVYDPFQTVESEIKEYETIYIGSVLVSDHTCIVVFIKRSNILHVVGESVGLRDTRAAIRYIKDSYPTNNVIVYPGLTRRTSTANNSTEVDYTLFKNSGYEVSSQDYDVPIKEITAACNEAFRTGKVLLDRSKCPTLALALEMQQFDDKGLPLNENGKFYINEAFSYPVYKILKIKRKRVSSVNSGEHKRIGGY